MPRIRSALLLVVLTPAWVVAQDTPAARMSAAFARADVPAAESAAREVLAADTGSEGRRSALMMLGTLAWRIRRDSTAAFGFYGRALDLPARRSATLQQRARAELSFENYAAAAADARAARLAATTASARAQAGLMLARVEVDRMLQPGADTAGIGILVRDLREAVAAAPGEAVSARFLMSAATIAHDGPALLSGWHSYYLALTNGGSTNILAPPRDTLDRVLPGWTSASDSRRARLTIVHALAASRLFDDAAWLSREKAADGSSLARTDARANEIAEYADFLREARRLTTEFYRLTALDAGDEGQWRDAVINAARSAWPNLSWTGAPPSFEFGAFLREAGARFGAITPGFGTTGGFKDIHYGHSVDDQRHSVEQYGQAASFRFVQLDEMLSNGFLSWFWDGSASDGGWQNSEMVVQVRQSYASGPIQSWLARSDTAQRRIADAAIAADSANDVARGRATPVAFFPSVGRRLSRAGETTLFDSLSAAGLAGEALRARFIQVLGEEIQAYSIFMHEGRHAIDAGLYQRNPLSNAELEFRAKLSQVAFAPRPQLAISSIMAANLGDQTPHGTANMRIMRGVLAWMTTHAAEIVNLDRAAPLLPQLPLLTTDQLRAAFRSLDPLTIGSNP